MNTKTDSTANTVTNTNTKRRLGVRRAFCASLAAITIGVGAGALSSASPASAASGVRACFQHKGSTARQMKADLELWSNGKWYRVASGYTSMNDGCVYASITGTGQNYPARWVLNHYDSFSGNTYWGAPNTYALQGSQYANFGIVDYKCYGSCTAFNW